jgi:hypothetical protein
MVAGLLIVALWGCGGEDSSPSPPPAPSSAVLEDGQWVVTIRNARGTAIGDCTFADGHLGAVDEATAIAVCRQLLGL